MRIILFALTLLSISSYAAAQDNGSVSGSVKAPAGLQLRCKNPGEIALSIVAELVGA